MPVISKSIIIGCLILLSVGFIFYGNYKRNQKMSSLGFGFLLFTIFIFFVYFPEYVDKFSAWAAVAVAIAAYAAFAENTRLRKENKEREVRENNYRLLKEIRDWAIEAAQAAINRQTRIPSVLWETKLKYKFCLAKSTYVVSITNSSFSDLSEAITNVIAKLKQARDTTKNAIENRIDANELVQAEQDLRESVEQLLIKLGSQQYTHL